MLTIFFLTFTISIFINKTYAASGTKCDSVGGAAVPGVNCNFYFPFTNNGETLPLCSSTPKASYDINTSYLLQNITANPRVNCMDLKDLPLCKSLNSPSPGKNCVKKCHEIGRNNTVDGAPAIRGTNYAVHNRDCVRFCSDNDLITGDAEKIPGETCSAPYCHQISDPVPYGSNPNCIPLPCNHLYAEEMNDDFIQNNDKPFCEGNDIRCYDYDISYHSSLIPKSDGRQNGLCLLHDCAPATILCGRGYEQYDGTLFSLNKSEDYMDSYIKEVINLGNGTNYDLYSPICNPTEKSSNCLPGTVEYYLCDTSDTGTIRDKVHRNCESKTATCNDLNQCLKATKECYESLSTIDGCLLQCLPDGSPNPDCNYIQPEKCEKLPIAIDDQHLYCQNFVDCNKNTEAPSCINIGSGSSQDYDFSTSSPSGGFTTPEDVNQFSVDFDSWFYRPSPHNKALKDNQYNESGDLIYRRMQTRHKTDNSIDTNFQYKLDICYTKDDMKDYNEWGNDVDLLGYFHDYASYSTRVPGACTTNSGKFTGGPGHGYTYLCGTKTIWGKAEVQTAYFKDYVISDYDSDGNATLSVTICVRFNNPMVPGRTCGLRECGVTYGFGALWGNACGRDVCRTLTIKHDKKDLCKMYRDNKLIDSGDRASLFTSSGNDNDDYSCLAKIDNDVRIRAVGFRDDYVCAFLDQYNATAYEDRQGNFLPNRYENKSFAQIIDPELVDEKGNPMVYCMSGNATPIKNDDGTYECKNSIVGHQDKELSQRWRQFLQVNFIDRPYKMNVSSDWQSYSGYKFHPKLCARAGLRIHPPDSFNIGTIENSERLFVPSIQISKVYRRKGGSEVGKNIYGDFDETDFYQPQIEATLGTGDTEKESVTISLDFNKASTAPGEDLEVKFMDSNYKVKVYVKKSQNSINGQPNLCLYRYMANEDHKLIQCVNRKFPELNFEDSLSGYSEKISVFPSPSNNYNAADPYKNAQLQTKINVRNGGTNNSTNTITFNMPFMDSKDCNFQLEQYKLCVKREECSQLNVEYVQNEIELNDKYNNNQSIDKNLEIRQMYNSQMVPKCKRKEGYIENIINGTYEDFTENAYGWFNEICIVEGFRHPTNSKGNKINYTVAHIVASGQILGKCIIDNSISSGSCSEGGNPTKGCYCLEYNTYGEAIGVANSMQDVTVRKLTDREAGLCIDIPIPQMCRAISYIDEMSDDYNSEDPYYTKHSINKTFYNDLTGVHNTHKIRTDNYNNLGSGEFPIAFQGMSSVKGSCNGFWQEGLVSGVPTSPMASCNANPGNEFGYFTNVRNPCRRYICPRIFAGDPDANGNYPGRYFDSGDYNIEEKGRNYGYAEWNSQSLPSDFMIEVTANNCVPGFRANGASFKMKDNSKILDNNSSSLEQIIDRSYKSEITGFDGGTKPTMNCDQMGIYDFTSLKNSCVRNKCYIKDPPATVGSLSNIEFFQKWADNRGAVFLWDRTQANDNSLDLNPTDELTEKGQRLYENIFGKNREYVLASRSEKRIQKESIIYGECVNNLGFFQTGNGKPSISCDHNGNIIFGNPCATKCNAITKDADMSKGEIETGPNHGYATWNETNTTIDRTLVYSQCLEKDDSGYKYIGYPYPPARNNFGQFYTTKFNNIAIYPLNISRETIEASTDATGDVSPVTSVEIPFDVKSDSLTKNNSDQGKDRTFANTPVRYCKSIGRVAGTNAQSSVWSSVNSQCVTGCPGFTIDGRLNVGLTVHPFSGNDGTIIARKKENGVIADVSVQELFGPNRVAVKWPNGQLNTWVHVEANGNSTGSNLSNLNSLNTADYRSPTNNKFSISRYCDQYGVWSEPIINCINNSVAGSTDTGQLISADEKILYSNDYYPDSIDSTTGTIIVAGKGRIPSSVKSFVRASSSSPAIKMFSDAIGTGKFDTTAKEYILKDAECWTGHYKSSASTIWEHDDPNRKFKPYICSPKDNYYIDQYYFKSFAGTIGSVTDAGYMGDICVKKCKFDSNATYGNAMAINGDQNGHLFTQGQTVSLKCKSGFGSATDGNLKSASSVSSDIRCGMPDDQQTYRTNNRPRITCYTSSNTPYWGNLQNDCSACRGCRIDSNITFSYEGNDREFTSSLYFSKQQPVHGDCKDNYGDDAKYDDNPSEFDRKATEDCYNNGSCTIPEEPAHLTSGIACRYYTWGCGNFNGNRCYLHARLSYSCYDGYLNLNWTTIEKDNEKINCKRGGTDGHRADEQCFSPYECIDCA